MLSLTELWDALLASYRQDEWTSVTPLLKTAELSPVQAQWASKEAMRLASLIRKKRQKSDGIEAFLTEYALSSEEGIALMCLAETLLRIPDKATINLVIADKLSAPDWTKRSGQSDSFLINGSTWGLILTGKILSPEKAATRLSQLLWGVVKRGGQGVIRKAVLRMMRLMSQQFIIGRTIEEALGYAKKRAAYRYSFDTLGEAAITDEDARRYFTAYLDAIMAIHQASPLEGSVHTRSGVSIKLSALHPRYQESQREHVIKTLTPVLKTLALAAKKANIGLTIDAEESERLLLSLDMFEKLVTDPDLAGWDGLGLAVQAYQKRAMAVIDWVAALARAHHRRIAVRLVKGAYWDSEIKKTQMQGLSDYPVFTHKVFSDVSYQACVKQLFELTDVIYPQFATHNAYTVATVLALAGDYHDFEFQCLYGMGQALASEILSMGRICRIYAPVGTHEALLPYLARRLLENGANASFVYRVADEHATLESLVQDPLVRARVIVAEKRRVIPLPSALFEPSRVNSVGIDLSDRRVIQEIVMTSPTFDLVVDASAKEVALALERADQAKLAWAQTTVHDRAACLLRYADCLQASMADWAACLCDEAKKTWPDAIGEVREAIDFCRYYAAEAIRQLKTPLTLTGYTGETNTLSLYPRGTVVCISPWNFPLAIFTGQVVAALVTGNVVIAKPAEQTPLIAKAAVRALHQAGVSPDVLQLLPGSGNIGEALVKDARTQAVLFTGSTDTARKIHQCLANRPGPIVPLIAETGGINAMLIDSSALLEQAVMDVLSSAFGSAGQRCSALRIVYVQDDIYDIFMRLLTGAMATLVIGDPRLLETDIGPVIDEEAWSNLKAYVLQHQAQVVYQCALPEGYGSYFMPPTVLSIGSIRELTKEVFGPILHVARFKFHDIDAVIEAINSVGYGLTFGIHSRITERIEAIAKRIHIGNCYVNRNMIGAVVGLQPFGGEGLSGTGPKAGGPHYLTRLCQERTLTVDTTAAGGNASLMSLVLE